MAERNVIAFLCPNCGAEVGAIEGYTNVKCEFCGSRLLMTEKIGAPRVFTRPGVENPEEILKSVAGSDIKIIDMDLLFIPLFRMRGEVIGWLKAYRKGEVKKERNTGGYYSGGPSPEYVRTKVVGQRTIKRRIRRIQEVEIDATAFYRFGIDRIRIEGKKFEVYNDNVLHKYGSVFDLPLSVDEYIEKASDILIEKNTDRYRDWDDFKHYLRVIKKSPIIYFNPIFFARIEKDGKPYTYSIDAVNGTILIRDNVIKNSGTKKTFSMNMLYLIIFGSGISLALTTHLLSDRIITFIMGLLVTFFLWWGQYGSR